MPEVATWTELAEQHRSQGLIALVGLFGADLVGTQMGLPWPEVRAAEILWEKSRGEVPEGGVPTLGVSRGEVPDAESLDSLPFERLCLSVLTPLLSLASHHQQRLFGRPPLVFTREQRQQRLEEFLGKELGLAGVEKVFWLSSERTANVRPWNEDRILRLLSQAYFLTLPELRKGLLEQGGVGALAASLGPAQGAPLASRVVTLCLMRAAAASHPSWPDLLKRCSPLERFVVVNRLAGKLDLAWGGRQETLLTLIAQRYGVVPPELLAAANALEDLPQLVERLEKAGPEALRSIVLRPLAAFRPALAQSLEGDPPFPCWVDCKYDGIRLLLHKELDGLGNLRFAAYTRKRNDWSELIEPLAPALLSLAPSSLILDGELHGRMLDPDGVSRPASVYEVHQALRGELSLPLRYVAFDLLYLQGQDLTGWSFRQRRQALENLLNAPRKAQGLPLELAQGSVVTSPEQLNRLYQQYRRQGHEGIMVKQLEAGYPLAIRSPAWLKRKPLETVELVLTAAYWGEGSRPGARLFDSYSLAARQSGSFREVGTVGGVDARTTSQLVGEIWRLQLLTGQSKTHQSARGTAQGVELRPGLVVTVAYEDLLWDRASGEISLRSPRILGVRSGEMPLEESTSWDELHRLALRSRLS